MNWSIPSLFERYLAFFEASPVWATLVAIVVIFASLMLMKIAIKLFLLMLGIVALVLVASYFINGEDQTNDAIRQGADQSSEMINQHLDKAEPKGG
jgi:ABC-type transport system involved in cytochrome bd biosynthesis fused ATPase/permease subunit